MLNRTDRERYATAKQHHDTACVGPFDSFAEWMAQSATERIEFAEWLRVQAKDVRRELRAEKV
jgi:hypothetical protein